MCRDRTAIETIKGYYYQFDYYILQLLKLQDDTDSVCIEGIEDVDIETANENTAVQCKYYEKTVYNHSVIAKSIRLMLSHYASTDPTKRKLKYKIYGYYKSGQDKLPKVIDVEFAKNKFLTYTKNKIKHEHHVDLELDETELEDFLKHLHIDNNAYSFIDQESTIINTLKDIFNCDEFEAEYYFYNNALRVVKELSIKQDILERTISKKEFITRINKKESLYNLWFLKKKGNKAYCNEMKKQFFSPLNVSPFERFFLIECDSIISDIELKTLLYKISNNWSKVSARETTPFCPYVYIKNTSENRLLNIKKALQLDSFYFLDGYDFKDAFFNAKSICRKANYHNDIKLKIVNEIDQIDEILSLISITREIYQFYILEPYYINDNHKHIKIRISDTKSITTII